MYKVIICIRVFNEERWLRLLLRCLKKQTYKNFEVVVVNNNSSDLSRNIAVNAHTTVVDLEEYNPSEAINLGLRSAISYDSAQIGIILSAHCIPVDVNWLENLVKSFETDTDIVGVYGRQIPMKSSNFDDMRDLLYTFGDQSYMHYKKVFFHNANSAVRMDYYRENTFNEELSHIEDLDWAQRATRKNKKIYYNADATVWHHHGIHQHNSKSFRSETVSETLKQLSGFEYPDEKFLALTDLNSLIVVEQGSNNKELDDNFVEVENTSNMLGADVVVIDIDPNVNLFSRIKSAVSEEQMLHCDIIYFFSQKYCKFDYTLVEKLHSILVKDGVDAVVPVRQLKSGICIEAEGEFMYLSDVQNTLMRRVYTTSFGRGAIFWSDVVWSSSLDKLKLSKIEID